MKTIEEAMEAIREKGYEIGRPVDVEKYGPDVITSKIEIDTVIGGGSNEASIQVYARSLSALTKESRLCVLVYEERLESHILDLASPLGATNDLLDNASEEDLIEMGLVASKTSLNK